MADYTEKHLLGADMDHDEQCVDQARQLISSGFMEEEFACYGCAYMENEEIKYYISSTSYSMQQFVNNCLKNNIYPSIPKYFVKRSNVTPGNRDHMRQMFKKEVAIKLRSQYPKVYFEALASVSAYQNDNAAMDLLFSIKADIESSFDAVALELFAEIVKEALLAQHLTEDGYQYWVNWIEKERQKMADEIQEWNYYQRTYAGYAVIENGKMRYRKDGMEFMTIERRNKDIAQGKTVTPILRKQYFASSDTALLGSAKSFQALMAQYLNNGLFRITDTIRNLQPVLPKDVYLNWLERVKAADAPNAIESFQYYGYLWGVL